MIECGVTHQETPSLGVLEYEAHTVMTRDCEGLNASSPLS